MNKVNKFLISLLLIVIISILAYPSWAQENDTVIAHLPLSSNDTISTALPSSPIIKNEVSQVDILGESQRNLDRSINILNIVATSMGILVGLFTAILVVGGIFGFSELRKLKEIREKAEKDMKVIKDIKKKVEEEPKGLIKRVTELERRMEELLEKSDKSQIKKSARTPADYMKLGETEYSKGNYETAIKHYEKAIKSKDYVYAWVNKCYALRKLGRHEEALESINRALKLKADRAWIWDIKGYILRKLGNHEELLKVRKKAEVLRSQE